MISFIIVKDEKITSIILFKDLILWILLKGRSTLSTLKGDMFCKLNNY